MSTDNLLYKTNKDGNEYQNWDSNISARLFKSGTIFSHFGSEFKYIQIFGQLGCYYRWCGCI